jgi:lipoyl(octanoyl) transferase
MRVVDLDTLGYRAAWNAQLVAHEQVVGGGEETIFLVEHPPTVTLGRRAADSRSHLTCDEEALKRRGVELVESDRGGDVTYHGPGQLVAYPIIRLADRRWSVGAYMRQLQDAVVATLAELHVEGTLDPTAVGVWVDDPHFTEPAKICAFGVRVRRGVTLHGLALNIEPRLSDYELIVPCGLQRPVTSLAKLTAHRQGGSPSFVAVQAILRRHLVRALAAPVEK